MSENGTPSKITYDIVTRDGKVLHSFERSYQPGKGEMPDWSWDQSREAEISWSKDSRYVAIDEQTHNYIGGVLLAEVTPKGAILNPFPEEAILAATKLKWDRERIRVADGWIAPDHLALGGRANRGMGIFFEQRSFEIILGVKGRATRIVLVEDTEPPPKWIPLKNGINAVDLNGDGKRDTVVVAHRENFNAHSFEATTFYVSTKAGLQIVPLDSCDKFHPGELITAVREFGETFANPRPVTFNFYHLERNPDSPGQAEYFFKFDSAAKSQASYCDVTDDFRYRAGPRSRWQARRAGVSPWRNFATF